MKIGIDVYGADKGVSIFKDALLDNNKIEYVLFGREEDLLLFDNKVKKIICSEVIEINDGLLSILHKKDSSLTKGLEALKNNEIDGLLTAGSTGALLYLAMKRIGLTDEVERACLVSALPTKKEKPVYFLDSGANSECTSNQLYEFAKLGKKYVEELKGSCERIALLNIGVEENKGDTLRKETFDKLKQIKGFIGNIEAREILDGNCDLIVTDGYSGNIALKSIEGTANFALGELKNIFKKNILSKIAAFIIQKDLKKMKERFNYSSYGGAYLLGLNKEIIKIHGGSDSKAVKIAIEQLTTLLESKL